MAGELAPPEHFLGALGARSVRTIIPISPEEYEELSRCLDTLGGTRTPFTYKLVERNHLALEDIYRFVVMLLTSDGPTSPDRQSLGESVMTATVNWLTSMRLFLDHESTSLSRRFGKGSSELERFKAATSRAYDNQLGYRLMYRFRNYVQHCGLPLSSLNIGLVDEGTEREHRRAQFLLKRDDLLASYDGWGAQVAADLRSMQPDFELLPLVNEAMQGLRDVYRELLEIRLDEALSVAQTLAGAIRRIDDLADDEGPAVLAIQIENRQVRHLTPRPISPAVVAALEEVAAGRQPRSSLLKDRVDASDDARPLTPDAIASALHPNNKALDVLALFFTEGGQTEAFKAHVNRLINDEEQYSPFIGGLIDASVVLASMAASLMGTDPRAMVSALQSMYLPSTGPPSEPDEPRSGGSG